MYAHKASLLCRLKKGSLFHRRSSNPASSPGILFPWTTRWVIYNEGLIIGLKTPEISTSFTSKKLGYGVPTYPLECGCWRLSHRVTTPIGVVKNSLEPVWPSPSQLGRLLTIPMLSRWSIILYTTWILYSLPEEGL